MICKHCGKSIPNTAQECPYCGKQTKGSFEEFNTVIGIGRSIAIIGALLILTSAFVPMWSGSFLGINFSVAMDSIQRAILIVSSIVGILAMLIPSLTLLYPVAAIAIGCASAKTLVNAWELFMEMNRVRYPINGPSLFSANFSPVFLVGFLIMTVMAVTIVMKRVFSKQKNDIKNKKG